MVRRMTIVLSFLALLACAAPQDRDEAVPVLLRNLGSDDPAVRDAATKDLARRGTAVEKALREAAKSPEAEVRRRTTHLLYRLELVRTLPPTLTALDPGLLDRLWNGDDRSWTASFLALFEEEGDGEVRSRDVKAEHLEPLALRAFAGAADAEERDKVLAIAADYLLRSPAPVLKALALDPAQNFQPRVQALSTLGNLGAENAREVVLELLGRSDDVLRMQAIEEAARLKLAEAVPPLRSILQDARDRHRFHAAQALARLGKDEAIPLLVEELVGANSGEAAAALTALGSPAAVPAIGNAFRNAPSPEAERVLVALGFMGAAKPLIVLLDHPAIAVRSLAASVLGVVRDPGASGRLAELVRKDGSPGVRRAAFDALARIEIATARSMIPQLLKDDSADLRASAVRLLEREPTPESLGLASSALRDGDAEVRAAAVLAMGSLSGPAERERLLPLLKDPAPSVAAAACAVLAAWGARETSELLTALVGSTDDRLSEWMIAGLEKLQPKGAVDAARRILTAPETPAPRRRNAIRALAAAAGPDATARLEALLDHEDATVRAAAVEELTVRDARGSARKVTSLLRPDADAGVVSAVLEYLRRCRVREAAPAILSVAPGLDAHLEKEAMVTAGFLADAAAEKELLRLVQDAPSSDLADAVAIAGLRDSLPRWKKLLEAPDRDLAIEALERLGSRESAPMIRPFLNGRAARTRVLAVHALGRLVGKEAVGDLRPLLSDRSGMVRAAAAEALGRLGAEEAAAGLLRLLEDPSTPARIAAAKALARMGREDGVGVLLREAARGDVLLLELNALRDPADWKRLASNRLPENVVGSVGEAGDRLAALAGLRWQADPASRLRSLARSDSLGIPSNAKLMALDEAWEYLLLNAVYPHDDLLLDGGTVKVVSRADALAFWTRWRASR